LRFSWKKGDQRRDAADAVDARHHARPDLEVDDAAVLGRGQRRVVEVVARLHELRLVAGDRRGDEGDSREDVEQTASSSQQPSAPDPSSAGANATAPARPSAPRGGTKLAEVVELLQRDRGATIGELVDATGWLPHTTHAALTGLRKRGFALAINRTDKERGSIYRIERDLAAENSAAGHSDVAQADSEPSSKKVHRHVKSKVRRAA